MEKCELEEIVGEIMRYFPLEKPKIIELFGGNEEERRDVACALAVKARLPVIFSEKRETKHYSVDLGYYLNQKVGK